MDPETATPDGIEAFGLRPGWSAVLFIACASSFAALAVAVTSGAIVEFDREVADALRRRSSDGLLSVLTVVSDLHAPHAIATLTAVAVLVAMLRRDLVALFAILLAVPGGATLNHVLKHSFMRPRPGLEGLAGLATDFSFPSGHVANATLLYGVLATIIVCRTRSRALGVLAVPCAVALVGLVAWSRLMLGAHHPSDVLAGMLVGLGWLMLSSTAHNAWRKRFGASA